MVPVNVPNFLTLLRILLVPVLVVALLDETPNGDLLAAIVFAAASLTDAIDGYLARTRQWVTTFGKLMDPLADKLLIIAALVALVSLNRVAAWVAMVIIAREFAVTVLRMAATQQGVVIAAGPFGKAKAVRAGGDGVRADHCPRQPAVAGRPGLPDGRGHGAVGRRLLLRPATPHGQRRGSATDPPTRDEPSARAVEPVAQTQVPGRDLA